MQANRGLFFSKQANFQRFNAVPRTADLVWDYKTKRTAKDVNVHANLTKHFWRVT